MPTEIELYFDLNKQRNFWKRVNQPTESCWPWQGSVDPLGYGRVAVIPYAMNPKGNKMRLAHRVAYELAYGPAPAGLDILHQCDNPSCCNPAHLRAGTHRENIMEAFDRGLMDHRMGEKASWSKLTEDAVVDIRTSVACGSASYKELAEKHNVCMATICNVVHRRIWKSLKRVKEVL